MCIKRNYWYFNGMSTVLKLLKPKNSSFLLKFDNTCNTYYRYIELTHIPLAQTVYLYDEKKANKNSFRFRDLAEKFVGTWKAYENICKYFALIFCIRIENFINNANRSTFIVYVYIYRSECIDGETERLNDQINAIWTYISFTSPLIIIRKSKIYSLWWNGLAFFKSVCVCSILQKKHINSQ